MAACSSSASEETSGTTTASSKAVNSVDISDVQLLQEGVLTVGCEIGYPPFEDSAEALPLKSPEIRQQRKQ